MWKTRTSDVTSVMTDIDDQRHAPADHSAPLHARCGCNIAAALAGDRAAFAALFDCHSPAVFGISLRVTRSREAAEEICQEVFIRLWRDQRFNPDRGSLQAWLTVVAHGAAVDWARDKMAAPERLLREGVSAADLDFSENDASSNDDLDRLRLALASLPLENTQAIYLAYYQGLSHSEIAGITSTALGTVKTRIRDGLRELWVLLTPADPHDRMQ